MTTRGRGARRPRLLRLVMAASAALALGFCVAGTAAAGTAAKPRTGLVELVWPAPGDGAPLVVERSDAGGPFRELATLPAGSTRYRDATVPPGKRSCYRVRRADDATPKDVAAACVESPAPGLPPVAAAPPGEESTSVRQRGPGGWYQLLEIPAPASGSASPPAKPDARRSPR